MNRCRPSRISRSDSRSKTAGHPFKGCPAICIVARAELASASPASAAGASSAATAGIATAAAACIATAAASLTAATLAAASAAASAAAPGDHLGKRCPDGITDPLLDVRRIHDPSHIVFQGLLAIGRVDGLLDRLLHGLLTVGGAQVFGDHVFAGRLLDLRGNVVFHVRSTQFLTHGLAHAIAAAAATGLPATTATGLAATAAGSVTAATAATSSVTTAAAATITATTSVTTTTAVTAATTATGWGALGPATATHASSQGRCYDHQQ